MKFLFLILFLFSLPGFGQEDEDKHLQDLEAQRRKQMELAVKLDESRQDLQEKTNNAIDELKRLGHSNITAASFLDEKVVRVIRKLLVNSPVRSLPREQVAELILQKSKGKVFGPFLMNNPKVLNTLVDILKDQEALPSLVGIFLRKDDLKYYFYLWLGIMLLGFLFKKFFFPVEWLGWKLVVATIALNIMIGVISVTIFYNIFHKELSPLVSVVTRQF